MSKNKGRFLTKFTARTIRRAAGNLTPVNPVASVRQHPQGRFSKSLNQVKRDRLIGGVTADE